MTPAACGCYYGCPERKRDAVSKDASADDRVLEEVAGAIPDAARRDGPRPSENSPLQESENSTRWRVRFFVPIARVQGSPPACPPPPPRALSGPRESTPGSRFEAVRRSIHRRLLTRPRPGCYHHCPGRSGKALKGAPRDDRVLEEVDDRGTAASRRDGPRSDENSPLQERENSPLWRVRFFIRGIPVAGSPWMKEEARTVTGPPHPAPLREQFPKPEAHPAPRVRLRPRIAQNRTAARLGGSPSD